MAIEQLHQGSRVRLHPIAIRRDPHTGEMLPQINDPWLVERRLDGGAVLLQNERTDHLIQVRSEDLRGDSTTTRLSLGFQVTLSGRTARKQPIQGVHRVRLIRSAV